MTNLEITRHILAHLKKPESLIRFVEDRRGHDRRYSITAEKMHALGWQPRHGFEKALAATVDWYIQNRWWWEKVVK